MDKQSDLIKLFSEAFEIKAFDKSQKCRFYCEKKESCKVTNIYPKYPGAMGDENTDIMLIAEAPSASKGYGAHNGGKVENFEKYKKSPLYAVVDFVKKNYHTIPYFTDLVKCGFQNQNNKSTIKFRIDNCMEKFLFKEIEIINPKTIFAIGKVAYNNLKKHRQKISSNIKIISLIHYGRQANLPLSIDEKEKIIWPIEAGLVDKKSINISELNYFKDI